MSTPNFAMMRDFPIYAKNYDRVCRVCGCCGRILDEDETCECDEEVEYMSEYDPYTVREELDEIQDAMDELNEELLFHKLSVQDGYYSGVQFFVESTDVEDIAELDDEDCFDEYGCNTAELRRKYPEEVERVKSKLKELAGCYGYKAYDCVAIFSNGEAVYKEVVG